MKVLFEGHNYNSEEVFRLLPINYFDKKKATPTPVPCCDEFQKSERFAQDGRRQGLSSATPANQKKGPRGAARRFHRFCNDLH